MKSALKTDEYPMTPGDFLEYSRSMLRSLSRLAEKREFSLLSHLIELAAFEAASLTQTEQAANDLVDASLLKTADSQR
jgi:hypothetical protein